MPRFVFQIVLPLYGLAAVAVILLARWSVQGRTGRDPVVFQPFADLATARGFLESVLALGIALSIFDVGLNALAPDWVAHRLAVPLLRDTAVPGLIGLGGLTLGLGLYAVAVRQMGPSWRIGIDAVNPGPLVTRGLYGFVRHPIYTSGMLIVIALAAICADALAIAVAAGGIVAFSIQARIEEDFLHSRFPQEFAAYESRTGRFWPRRRRP